MRVFGLDLGKHALKVVTGEGRFSVRSKVDETNETEVANETFLLGVNGKRYMIGDYATNEDYDVSKEKIHHKLLMYLGLAKFSNGLQDSGLIVGCPISLFLNRDKRESFRTYLLDGAMSVEVNGARRSLNVRDIKIVPEGIGFLYKNPTLYRDKLVGVVDIGGLNTNGAIYEGLKPIKGTEFTLNEGGYILNTKIKNAIKSSVGANVQDYEIPHIIKNGLHPEIVDVVMRGHIQAIVKEMQKTNWNTKGILIMFIGGGSHMLSKYITEAGFQVSDGGIWDNAEGFYKMGLMLYGG